MIHYYQPQLLPFLGLQLHLPPVGVTSRYYHSFEDALWHFLQVKKIPLGATILFPNYYCQDVTNNVQNHGYHPIYYPLDDHLQPIQKTFMDTIKKHQPAIVVLFHACGITNHLISVPDWLDQLPSHTYLIEDSVHRLINPTKIVLIHPRHIIIDSLRKVSPLHGSFLYGHPENINFPAPKSSLFVSYRRNSWAWFIAFRALLLLAQLTNLSSLATLAHDTLLKHHDDIIGDSFTPHAGLSAVAWLHGWINHDALSKRKSHQVRLYFKLLRPITQNNTVFKFLKIPTSDYARLHVFPMIVKGKPKALIEYLAACNISTLYKFSDCMWSENRGVLFLPIGFHIETMDIHHVAEALKDYINGA